MSNINSVYFIRIMPKIGGAKAPSAPIMPKIGGAKAPSAPPPVPTPMVVFWAPPSWMYYTHNKELHGIMMLNNRPSCT